MFGMAGLLWRPLATMTFRYVSSRETPCPDNRYSFHGSIPPKSYISYLWVFRCRSNPSVHARIYEAEDTFRFL
jgi:hypothetical protein